MRCPACHAVDTKVVDSRSADEGAAIRRRRQCPECKYRFTTFERMDEVPLVVIKSSDRREPFDRAKIVAGVLAAAKGRPVDVSVVETLAETVEEQMRLRGPEVSSNDVGLAVLEQLGRVDEVVYLRFASVYKDFVAAADFRRELTLLEKLSTPVEID
ncbi:MAG: transcriptional regulator NrdR [Ilumatobacteraceae bacterium]